jgi:hypothetical protein
MVVVIIMSYTKTTPLILEHTMMKQILEQELLLEYVTSKDLAQSTDFIQSLVNGTLGNGNDLKMMLWYFTNF